MRFIKRVLLGLIIIVGITIALVYVYKDTLIRKVVDNYNKNYNLSIDFKDTDLSFFKKFPHAFLTIHDLSVFNDDVKDTLFVADKVYLAMNIEDLFKKSDEKISINDLVLEKAKLNLIVNEDETTTFNVKKLHSNTKQETSDSNTKNNDFVIDVNKYQLTNSEIVYHDKKGAILFELKELNHKGNGDFSASKLDLKTSTRAQEMTVKVGKVTYFNKVKIDLDAVLGIDLDNLKFQFKENTAKINDLALVFNGFIDINDTNQLYDIEFNASKANFKNLLSLVPSAYSSNFSGVTANGIADVNGFFKGELSDNSFPKYNIHINTNKASFKYPDLPKTVTDIDFNGNIASNTNKNNVFLNIKNLKFTIDKDTFETKGKITKLTSNPTVDASFKGTLDLENLSKAYPIKMDNQLKGILQADFTTFTDNQSIKNNQYDKIKTNGTASLSDFSYDGEEVAHPIHIKNAAIKFNTNSVLLTNFDAKTGKSDLKAKGKLDNLFAFVFDDKNLQGNFDITSNNFIVSDFLVESENTSVATNTSNDNTTSGESLKIPSFLDINTTFKAKNVVYDNIQLQNVSGIMSLKNQKATLKNTKANLLEGAATFNGDIDTKPSPAVFDLDMNIDKFDIANSFNTLETFKGIVPIAKALKGKYNSTFKIKGNLSDDFSPDLNSLSGNAFAQLFVKDVDKSAIPLVSQLNSNLNFIDFSKIDLSKLKTALSFKNGRVSVNPFTLKYQDVVMHISGSHGFDKSLTYNLKMDVPAKYLGTEAVNLLSKLTNINKDTIKIPLSTLINGSMLKPNIKVNFKQALNNLALKVMEYQKQELTNQATSQVNNTIDDLLSSTGIDSILPTSTDSTHQNPKDIINNGVKDGVKGLLDGLLGGKKKK